MHVSGPISLEQQRLREEKLRNGYSEYGAYCRLESGEATNPNP